MLARIEASSVDACVTDPPYGLKFMGKKWDAQVPTVEEWRAVYRVLKPGAHVLAFGGTRTYHRMVCAVEDAGFEIRDQIAWLFGSGFPKSHNLEDELDGWGTALKPAHEPIVLARKPLDGTVAENAETHGTGALNINASRIAGQSTTRVKAGGANQFPHEDDAWVPKTVVVGSDVGRWPANVVHDGSDEVLAHFPETSAQAIDAGGRDGEASAERRYTEAGGTDFAMLPGQRRGDSGSAARFFYCAKASREDREDGLAHIGKRPLLWSSGTQSPGTFQADGTDRSARNNHPTVKPTDLMRWLCRLVTPPGGTIIDPYMGSGSTGRGAFLEEFSFIGIERDAQWLPIAEARIRAIAPLFAQVETL